MKAFSTIKIAFPLVGIGLLSLAVFMALNTSNFLKAATAGAGEVIDLVESVSDGSTTYAPVVRFATSNGQEYEFKSNTSSNPPSYNIGESVEVLYIHSSPSDAKINGFFSLWGVSIISGILGAVFFTIGLGLGVFSFVQGRSSAYLKENGKVLKATLKDVELNDSLEVNGKNPYKLIAEWTDPVTQKNHTFISKNIWFNPTDHISEDVLTVYVDKLKPKKYLVDISFLDAVAE
tara:strand:+ start:388 stop:1086 length:699 start_codon:yes stop_codon:yes gene_type:complete